jgi:subtilisin family serine protease
MKKFYFLLMVALLTLYFSGYSQTKAQNDTLKAIAQREAERFLIKKSQAIEWANLNGIPVTAEKDGSYYEIQYIDDFGRPQYYKTDNSNAAATISTNKVYSGGGAGLSLTGSGITVREWDAGSALSTHQEFGSRVMVVDGAASNYHSTHVAGTIMASGVVPNAKGMAYAASLRSFDWNSVVSEMATEGSAGALLSNHSWGFVRGWDGSTWYGNPSISTLEDYLFGFYDSNTQQWDQVAQNAPYFLICKAAGNDRGDSGTGYPADGPYDCLDQLAVGKNILTVGAVDDIPEGYTTPSGVVMSSFSSWGPADDGRIKPDIVANGIGLYSTYNTSNTSYATLSGTSMATPSVTGSLALLQQHYNTLKSHYLRSATLKALVIHTADEAGPDLGPDYMFGWGLMNTRKAALKISEDLTTDVIGELTLNNGSTYSRGVVALGTEPLKVTIVWTDPAGTPPAASLDPIIPMLVNDLDLRITYSGSTFYPWKLDRDNPGNAATNTGENNVDNVEVVYIANPVPGATYTITIDHDGTLTGGTQAYSIVISGISSQGTAVVNTTPASGITLTSAISGGNITADGGSAIIARGVCWATTTNPDLTGNHTADGAGTGTYTSSITGLTPTILYHIRAYATNGNGTFYGDDLTFTALGVVSVTTAAPTGITQTGAISGGTASTDGGYAITGRGVCWANTANPTITGNHTSDGSGPGLFVSTISGLTSGALYHVRAYITTATNTYYGSDLTFSTLCPPIGAFNEGFENTAFPPTCWILNAISGSYNWSRSTFYL